MSTCSDTKKQINEILDRHIEEHANCGNMLGDITVKEVIHELEEIKAEIND